VIDIDKYNGVIEQEEEDTTKLREAVRRVLNEQ
jgi:hypothetical protein